ncbi:hypothetical protein C0995_001328 [Termitomyces sp. Mi166|nr:hypothetical protein C0995_001328 [Termitomyces sp. Mi166\
MPGSGLVLRMTWAVRSDDNLSAGGAKKLLCLLLHNVVSTVSSVLHRMDALRQPHTARPSNDDIEAVIQAATSARTSPDARTVPIKDTRTQLFVGNLPYRVRWQDLKDLFRRAGTVLRADVSLGPDNRSRGYGTVLLATAEDAGRAIDLFNGYSWQNRILEVRPDRLPLDYDANHPPAIVSAPREEDVIEYSTLLDLHHNFPANLSLRSLFVGNLPFHCQWQDLKDLFRRAGTIMRADVALGQDGRSRGFGTVTFATESDADRAVQMFDGCVPQLFSSLFNHLFTLTRRYEYNGRTLKVNHDKFTQLNQLSLGASLTSSISPAPSVRSAPDSRAAGASLSTAPLYQTRPLPSLTSLTQSANKQLSLGYLGASTSSSPAPFDVWPQQQQEKPRDERELLRSFSGLDLGSRLTRVASTLSTYSAPAPSASRSSTSSTKPPSIATATSTGSTGSLISSSSLTAVSSSVSTSTSASSNEAHFPLSFQRHRGMSATKEDTLSSPPASSASASAASTTPASTSSAIAPTVPPPSNPQKLRSPPRHPGPIALPPPPHVTSFSHPPPHVHPHSPHGIPGLPLHHPHSPLFAPPPPMSHHPQQPQAYQVTPTPLGLSLTPSMPPFNFLPPGSPSASIGTPAVPSAYAQYAHQPLPSPIHVSPLHHPHVHALQASHAHAHPLSSHSHARPHAPFGITPLSPPTSATAPTFASSSTSAAAAHFANFSPGATMSPGAFWGRPGHGPPPANPLINPAVGAPVHVSEPTGYFDGAWFGGGGAEGEGAEGGGSVVESEISKGRDEDEGTGNDEEREGEVLDSAVGVARKVDGKTGKDDVVLDVDVDVKVNGDEAHTDTQKTQEKQRIRPRPRRHSSTIAIPVPWQTSLAPKSESEHEDHDDGASEGAVDLNSELALLVKDGVQDSTAAAVSRTHSMSSSKKPVELGLGLLSISSSNGNNEDGLQDRGSGAAGPSLNALV